MKSCRIARVSRRLTAAVVRSSRPEPMRVSFALTLLSMSATLDASWAAACSASVCFGCSASSVSNGAAASPFTTGLPGSASFLSAACAMPAGLSLVQSHSSGHGPKLTSANGVRLRLSSHSVRSFEQYQWAAQRDAPNRGNGGAVLAPSLAGLGPNHAMLGLRNVLATRESSDSRRQGEDMVIERWQSLCLLERATC